MVLVELGPPAIIHLEEVQKRRRFPEGEGIQVGMPKLGKDKRKPLPRGEAEKKRKETACEEKRRKENSREGERRGKKGRKRRKKNLYIYKKKKKKYGAKRGISQEKT